MIYQNVRGLRTKQDEIFASLIDFDFDVVALTETWLSNEHCDVNLFPDCYHVFRADRDYAATLLQRGGGSAILVKSSIRCDFNVSGVCWSTRSLPANIGFYAKCKARSVFDFVDMMNLDVFTHESTDPSFCNNGLDLILTNCRIFTRAAEALVCPDKFHPPFEIGFLEVATVDVAETGLVFRYDRGDYRALYDDVRFADWCNVLLTVDLEESVLGLQKIITAAIDKHVPAFRPKSTKFPPWFNRNIVNLLKRKKAAHRRFKSSDLKTGINMRTGRILMSSAKCVSKKTVKLPSIKSPPNAKVTIWGSSFLTKTILLDLKMSPLLEEIRIFDEKPKAVKLANDLNQIESTSVARPFYGSYQIGFALEDVDVIVLAAGHFPVPGQKKNILFKRNLPIVLDMAYECAHHNPTAAVVVLTPPGTRNVPMISELYGKIGINDGGQIMSPMYHYEMVACKLVCETLRLPASVVSVPVVGGCCPDTIIPVFSLATPQNEFSKMEMENILTSLRKSHEKVSIQQKGRPPSLSVALAASKLVQDIVLGRFAMEQEPCSVFLKSDVIMNVKYLGAPVSFGPGGVQHNKLLPQLTDKEMKMLGEAVVILQKDAKIAEAAASARWNEFE
ncbi:uncharacterized protein LOC142318534 [Lycorma delicatula]|uniref:uncharacterized protein LOC142318534 n=1 Tax=Lycorma delicatula TaxID=130591 RepID=UPI003F510740